MSAFDESQDLGQDFVFETDPNSLQRILDNRELSPRSVLAMRMSSKLIKPTLSPARGAPKQVRENPEKFDFFESKKGDVFWRPKTPKAKVTGGSNTKSQKFGQKQRALGRVAINALPQRLASVNENCPYILGVGGGSSSYLGVGGGSKNEAVVSMGRILFAAEFPSS